MTYHHSAFDMDKLQNVGSMSSPTAVCSFCKAQRPLAEAVFPAKASQTAKGVWDSSQPAMPKL